MKTLNVVDIDADSNIDFVHIVMEELSKRGIMLAMLEGGGRLAGSFFDAGEIDKSPGEIDILKLEDIKGTNLSTHSMPINIFCDLIKSEIETEIYIIAIQPLQITIGSDISDVVAGKIDLLVDAIKPA